ncbi:MAG TPA: gluconate 2-dehydrogenase subunit 3 family protein, partial [Mycobacteriales bacterium]|nr:gluconate 2-dehydrogenase subunit 3 family protein [Mycobacteriales bacterium]
REAGVVGYIDTLLAAFTPSVAMPPIHAGGPFSSRPDPSRTDDMATFAPLTRVQRQAWTKRVAQLQQTYRDGVVLLDGLSGGDFTTASAPARDAALMQRDAAGFRDVLFTHAIEGTYSVPEYGGNLGLVGWEEIHFTGDVQPVGWSDAKVARSDGPNPAVVDGVVQSVVDLLRASGGG